MLAQRSAIGAAEGPPQPATASTPPRNAICRVIHHIPYKPNKLYSSNLDERSGEGSALCCNGHCRTPRWSLWPWREVGGTAQRWGGIMPPSPKSGVGSLTKSHSIVLHPAVWTRGR